MAVAACLILGAGLARSARAAPHRTGRLTVMTYNVYLGADLRPLFGVDDPEELTRLGAEVFEQVERTDFRARAAAIAREIVSAEPDVVALQEVALWQTAPLSSPKEVTTRYDFLKILLRGLRLAGGRYEPAVRNRTFHGALRISETTLGLFTDRNVIVVRSDLRERVLRTSDPARGVFAAALPAYIGDASVRVTRGWAAVDVIARGTRYRVFDTHLEAYDPVIRTLQASELAGRIASSPDPVVLAGDLNLYPEGERIQDVVAWGALDLAGMRDAWLEAGDGPGFTAGQDDDLDNEPSALDHRIDYVLHTADVVAVPGSGDVVGDEPDDRTTTDPPLWPSDHAGVVSTLRKDALTP
jgi:endonuclease/exonuclease/phosphatase family metal-dependent hydrolase